MSLTGNISRCIVRDVGQYPSSIVPELGNSSLDSSLLVNPRAVCEDSDGDCLVRSFCGGTYTNKSLPSLHDTH